MLRDYEHYWENLGVGPQLRHMGPVTIDLRHVTSARPYPDNGEKENERYTILTVVAAPVPFIVEAPYRTVRHDLDLGLLRRGG